LQPVANLFFANMEELRRLKQQMMALQQAPAKPRLSERNLVEIIKKLMDSGSLPLYFSSNGKDFLTPTQLEEEILLEVRRQGRVNLIELPAVLGINIEYIERHSAFLLTYRKDLEIVDGQLISQGYMDVLAQEVDDLVALAGQVQISELAKRFALPSDYLRRHLSAREGSILHGQVKDAQVVTGMYLQRHYAKLRGTLRGCTEPISLKTFDVALVPQQLADMIKKGEVRGSQANLVFTPAVYTEAIEHTVQTLYKSSLHIDYDSVKRIVKVPTSAEARRMLNSIVPGGVHLETCYMDAGLIASFKQDVAVALTTHKVVKCRDHLEMPALMQTVDIPAVLGEMQDLWVLEDTIWSESALQEITQTFESVAKRIVEEAKTVVLPSKGAKKKGRGDAFSSSEVVNHLKKARCLEKYKLNDIEAGYDALAARLYGKVLALIDQAKETTRPSASAMRKKDTGTDLLDEFSLLQLCVKALTPISSHCTNVSALQAHISKAVLTPFYVNLMKKQLEHQGVEIAEEVKFVDRQKWTAALPDYLKQIFGRLGEAIRERRCEDFVAAVLEAKQDLPAVILQPLDKKKERVVLHKQRLALKEVLSQSLATSNSLEIAQTSLQLRLVDEFSVFLSIPQENWAVLLAVSAYEAVHGQDDVSRYARAVLDSAASDALDGLKEPLASLLK